MTTAVPAPSFSATGISAPAETAILAGRQADFSAAFGTALNTDLRTPQGQLASSETAIIGGAYDALLLLMNLVDPAKSYGRFQDAIGRFYYQYRTAAKSTVVSCVCVGAAKTPIPAGARAKDLAGNIYAAVSGGTIPASGTITLDFANVVTGAIACSANTLTTIYQAIPGWDTINNPADGVLGQAVETSQAFETRRRQSVALNANGTIPAIRGAVLAVDGVVDAYVTDNATANAQTINGVSVPAYALYVAVSGGSDQDVARAIWTKKQPGGPYYSGSSPAPTTVTVADNRSDYSTPPTYQVSFVRAVATDVKFQVIIANNVFVPNNAQALIAAAIINAMAGGDGGPRATIGSRVLASRYYAPVALLGTWAQIVHIQVSLDGTTWSDSVTLTMAQIPTVATGDVTVTVQ